MFACRGGFYLSTCDSKKKQMAESYKCYKKNILQQVLDQNFNSYTNYYSKKTVFQQVFIHDGKNHTKGCKSIVNERFLPR